MADKNIFATAEELEKFELIKKGMTGVGCNLKKVVRISEVSWYIEYENNKGVLHQDFVNFFKEGKVWDWEIENTQVFMNNGETLAVPFNL